MAIPIAGGTAFDFGAAAQAPAVQPQPTITPTASARQPTSVEPSGDTVKLSAGAQVRLLSSQGETVPEITVDTALSAQAVNSYLGNSRTLAPPATTNS
jgi:hypothetical protein